MVTEVRQDDVRQRNSSKRVGIVVTSGFRWAENQVRNSDQVEPFAYSSDGVLIIRTFPGPHTRWQALERGDFYRALLGKFGQSTQGEMIAGKKIGEVSLADVTLESNMLRHLQSEFYGLVYRFPVSSRIGEPLELSCSRNEAGQEVWYLGDRR